MIFTALFAKESPDEGYLGPDILQESFAFSATSLLQNERMVSSSDLYHRESYQKDVVRNKGIISKLAWFENPGAGHYAEVAKRNGVSEASISNEALTNEWLVRC